MPHEIKFDQLPGGYVLNAARSGDVAHVQTSEFTSSEDGQHFIERLEGLPSDILTRLGDEQDFGPSRVDHLLAVIRRDHSATVFLNELPIRIAVRANKAVNRGEAVFKNDIVDITELRAGDVEIPNDAGVVFVFSCRWRKGLFYDLGPLGKDGVPRSHDCRQLFGQLFAYLMFQERFSISEQEWETLQSKQWFPFAAFKNETITGMLRHVRAGWDLDELLPEIVAEVKGRASGFLESWKRHPVFQEHATILDRAIERFLTDDHVSCTGLLFPRIEGILRSNLATLSPGLKAKQENLAMAAVSSRACEEYCLLLPRKFEKYLSDVYFANFEPTAPKKPFSRHTVSHGIACQDDFSAKASVVGILVIHQLFYCLPHAEIKP